MCFNFTASFAHTVSACPVPGAVPRSWAISEAAPVQGGDKDLPSTTVWPSSGRGTAKGTGGLRNARTGESRHARGALCTRAHGLRQAEGDSRELSFGKNE